MRPTFSIRQRTILGFVVMILLVLIASGMGMLYTRRVETTVNTIRAGASRVEAITNVRIGWLNILNTVDSLLLTRQISLIERQLLGELANLNQRLAVLDTRCENDNRQATSPNQAELDELRLLNVELGAVTTDLIEYVQNGEWAHAQYLRHNELAALQRRFQETLDRLGTQVRNEVDASVVESVRTEGHLRAWWAGTGLAALLFGSLATVAMTGSLVRSISSLMAGARAVADGDLSRHVDVHSSDELGILANAFNTMTAHLRDLIAGLELEIAERKHAEELLAESEERYRGLFEGVPVGLYRSTPAGQFITVNPAIVHILGYPDTEGLLATPIPHLYVDPEVRSAWRALVERQKVIHGFEALLRRHDGTSIWIRDTARAVRDTDGQVAYYEGTLEDITRQKEAEDALRQLSTAMEQALDAIVITTPDGTIGYANAAFSRITGIEPTLTINNNLALALTGSREAPFFQEVQEIMATGQAGQGRFSGTRPDGTSYVVDTVITPVRDAGGQIVNYVTAMRDVTREELLEKQFQQAQKMEALGRLAGGIAHDFNNLLTVIQLNAQLLQWQIREQDPLREHVQEIDETARRGAALTRQLLSFSRREVVERRTLNLNLVVRSLMPMLERLIGENILLETHIADDLWPVRADPSQIEQVLVNLVVNARDAMPHGGKVTIETANITLDKVYAAMHVDAQAGDHVMLAVADTGIGMSDELKGRIFEPFFTTKQRGQGTGLGLSTVFGIVKQSEGHIQVYSEPGHGTTFKIYWPRTSVGETEAGAILRRQPNPAGEPGERDAGASSEISQPYSAAGGTETVLLVEDDESVRAWAQRVLGLYGYRVLVAAGGDEAAELSRSHQGPIHLLLTDVLMPNMNGPDLARKLQAERPEMRVLFTSGHSGSAISQHGVPPGGAAFLSKPFTLESLALRVRTVLDGDS
ncbi:MAG: PAS domain S-box protein [Anaerolineae bacterium]|nr:PAS domain S-box protein [Anaerolineae bacterium]